MIETSSLLDEGQPANVIALTIAPVADAITRHNPRKPTTKMTRRPAVPLFSAFGPNIPKNPDK